MTTKTKSLDLLLISNKQPGVSYIEKDGYRKIAISFTQPIFDQIRFQAIKEGKSISEVVVSLVQAGHLCVSESDAMEPKENTVP